MTNQLAFLWSHTASLAPGYVVLPNTMAISTSLNRLASGHPWASVLHFHGNETFLLILNRQSDAFHCPVKDISSGENPAPKTVVTLSI